jgi:hypothetical protein
VELDVSDAVQLSFVRKIAMCWRSAATGRVGLARAMFDPEPLAGFAPELDLDLNQAVKLSTIRKQLSVSTRMVPPIAAICVAR